MQNKGAITLLTIALALVSLYQLSFTWKTNRVDVYKRQLPADITFAMMFIFSSEVDNIIKKV